MDRLDVREQILMCDRCELHKVGKGPVPFSGPTPAYMAVIGEAPGRTEDLEGAPFVGRAGQLLRECLIEAGIRPELLMFCNAASCFPDGTPTSAHVHACARNLEDQLELANPSWVLVLGAVALSTIRTDLKISRARGHLLQPVQHRWRYYITFHPSYALRNPKGEKILREDLVILSKMVDAEDTPAGAPGWVPLVNDSCLACGASVEEMGEHDLHIMFDSMGGSYCSDCWDTKSPEGKAVAKEMKGIERVQIKTGALFK